MLKVLRNVDASLNNIGRLRIEPSAEALMFRSSIIRPLTDWQLIVLDNFVDSLKASGAWAAIQHLHLPFVSFVNGDNAALLNSFIDFKKTWDTGVLTKSVYATDAKLLANFKYANRGIERTNTPLNYSELAKYFRIQEDTTTLTNKNSHVLLFKVAGTYPSSPTDNRQYFGNVYDALKHWPQIEQLNSTQARIGVSTVASNNVVGLDAAATNIWIGYSANGNTMYKVGTSVTSYNTTSETEFTLDQPLQFGQIVQNQTFGGVSFGHALTLAQINGWRTAWAEVVKFL